MSTSMLLTGAGSSGPGGSGEVDPLDGIAYRLRFETTWDKVALRPMWQDVARTTPVTGEGDQVATMGSEDAELVPEQGDEEKKGTLFLAADGTPYIDLDGVDDWYLTQDPSSTTIYYTCLLHSKSPTWNSYFSLYDRANGGPGNWGVVEQGQTNWAAVPPNSMRRDGVDLVSPFDCAPIDEWMVLTVQSAFSANVGDKGLFQMGLTFFGSLETVAFFVYDGPPSNVDRGTVEAFYETLKPAP